MGSLACPPEKPIPDIRRDGERRPRSTPYRNSSPSMEIKISPPLTSHERPASPKSAPEGGNSGEPVFPSQACRLISGVYLGEEACPNFPPSRCREGSPGISPGKQDPEAELNFGGTRISPL